MQEKSYISIVSNRKMIAIDVNTILYIIATKKKSIIHVVGNKTYNTGTSLLNLEKMLGDVFIKIHRGCLVSVMAIHDVTDKVNLSNGESLEYTLRKKRQIIEQLHSKQKKIIDSFSNIDIPETQEEYFRYYRSFDNLPIAFTDIEMVFDEKKCAVDWIFRYGNAALSKLEKLPLDKLIGNSFSSLFSNMDSKWLKSYERTALYNETVELIDFSPEIDTYLKVTCFPTFKGHCGCILFDINEIKFMKNSREAHQALKLYLGKTYSEDD